MMTETDNSISKYRLYFERSPLPYQSLDPDGKILEVNPAWLELLGYSNDEVIGEPFLNFLAPLDQKVFKEHLSSLEKSGRTENIHFKLKHKSGREIIILLEGSCEFDDKGNIKRTYCILKDVTREHFLQESYQSLIEHSTQGYGILQKGQIVFANSALGIMTGYTEQELLELSPEKVHQLFHPEAREWAWDVILSCLTKPGKSEKISIPWMKKNGEVVWADTVINQITFQSVPAVQFTLTDITLRKEAQKRMENSETRYKQLFESVPIGLYRSAPDGTWVDLNQSMVKLLGYPNKKALLKINISNLYVNPEDEERWFQEISETGVVKEYETELYRYDGSRIWVLDNTKSVFDDSGTLIAYEGGMQDITDQKQTQILLEESEEKYRGFFQTSQNGVFITDLNGRWLEVNDELLDLFGAQNIHQLNSIKPDDLYLNPQTYEQHLKQLEVHGCTKSFYAEMKRVDGSTFDALLSASPFVIGGRHLGYQGTIQDISKQVQQTRQLEKYNQELIALQEISIDLTEDIYNKEILLKKIVERALELVGAKSGSFNKPDHDAGLIDIVFEIGYRTHPEITEIKKGEGLVGRSWVTGETICVEDYSSWEFRHPSWTEHLGSRPVIAVPIRWGKTILGVIELLRPQGNSFTQEDINILEMFANQAAVVLHNSEQRNLLKKISSDT